ncbi:thioredoxin family protein [Bowmanella denitrificans]|uniref:Thioredoxin family protein n=1 Tax=Bowmanella denitrificans TaxID=366582 RepID=A0ABN0XNC7_9ALTE
MKQLKAWLAALVLFALPHSTLAAVKADSQAPDFTLKNIQGEAVRLSNYQGKYVILEWTNHLCPYVQKHYDSGNMQALQQKYTAEDVVWLSIISSAPGKQGHVSSEQAQSLSEERKASPSQVLFDENGAVGKLYGAKTTPHMYVIDPQGILRYAGAIDSIKSANPADITRATNYVDAAMSALKSGQEVTEKMTVPYGCSVKYAS